MGTTATEAKVVDGQVVEGPGAKATAEAAPVTPPAGSPLAEALAKTKAQAEAAEAQQTTAPTGVAQATVAPEHGGKA